MPIVSLTLPRASPARDASPRGPISAPRRRLPPTSLPTAAKEGPKEASEYVVGYGRPPIHTRFKPGTSGNVRGRPKGAKGLKTIARQVLTTKVVVRTGSGERKMQLIEAIMLKTAELGTKGNVRAATEMMTVYSGAVPETDGTDPSSPVEDLTITDRASLEELRAILLQEMADERAG